MDSSIRKCDSSNILLIKIYQSWFIKRVSSIPCTSPVTLINIPEAYQNYPNSWSFFFYDTGSHLIVHLVKYSAWNNIDVFWQKLFVFIFSLRGHLMRWTMWFHGFYYDKVDNQTKMSGQNPHQGEDPLQNECQGTLALDQTQKRLIASYFLPCLICHYSLV